MKAFETYKRGKIG